MLPASQNLKKITFHLLLVRARGPLEGGLCWSESPGHLDNPNGGHSTMERGVGTRERWTHLPSQTLKHPL